MDFVLTSDLDWASEYCIENFLDISGQFSIKPTIFVTHESPAIRRAVQDGRVELGIHPNFVAPSTHGDRVETIIAHTLSLAPRAVAVRCHRHAAGPRIERALAERGLRVDSNTFRHLEPNLVPIQLSSGLLRLPVFFEDDCHWAGTATWRFEDHESAFFSPGLKVLNFHPFFVALNAPDASFYARHKSKIPTLDATEAARLRYKGWGAGTFLVEALAAIRDSGHGFVTLTELAEKPEHAAARVETRAGNSW